MMKNKSSIKRTRRGYTLRLTKAEFDVLFGMVDEANGCGDYEQAHYSSPDRKKQWKACQNVMRLMYEC